MSELVAVSGAFDDLRSGHIRFLEEASRIGDVRVFLWPDALIQLIQGRPPKFPEAERRYFLDSIRYVREVVLATDLTGPDSLPIGRSAARSTIWVVSSDDDNDSKRAFASDHQLDYRVLAPAQVGGFPMPAPRPSFAVPRRKVIVTGCYDWLHSGHVRFFEEVSAYGELYVVLGRDENIRLLKGDGHPLLSEQERRYVVGSIRYVKEALLGTGHGWLDAEPEIHRLRPDIYAVNEDGDKGGKREFCAKHGIEYLVLKRQPASGLPRRSSTELRGF